MATVDETETETLFLRLPPQLKAVLVETVGHMNAERMPGSPMHTINSVAAGILWAFFAASDSTRAVKFDAAGAAKAAAKPRKKARTK